MGGGGHVEPLSSTVYSMYLKQNVRNNYSVDITWKKIGILSKEAKKVKKRKKETDKMTKRRWEKSSL